MGSYSWMCKGRCGKAICEGEEVVGLSAAVYEGYGEVGEGEDRAVYHRQCFDDLVGGRVDLEPGEHDPDQGFGYADPAFVPAGTKLYESELEVLKGRAKVGVLVDVSGSSPALRPGDVLRDATGALDAAFHYLGIETVELITFDNEVCAQGAVPAKQLRVELCRNAEKWLRGGGGGDNVAGAVGAAVAAGCDALVLVSDGFHTTWPQVGPPVVLMRLFDPERDDRERQPQTPDWVKGKVLSPYYVPLDDDERAEIEARVIAEMEDGR
jgi:hypothetical protein